MHIRSSTLFTSILLLGAVTSIRAATLDPNNLPVDIYNCWNANDCGFYDFNGTQVGTFMTAYHYYDLTLSSQNNGADLDRWLLRYDLYSPSTSRYGDTYTDGTFPGQLDPDYSYNEDPVSGEIWLSVSSYLSGSETRVEVYGDKSSLPPYFNYAQDPGDQSTLALFLDVSAALSSEAYYRLYGDLGGAPNEYSEDPNSTMYQTAGTCVECSWRIDLALIGVDYDPNAPNDPAVAFNSSDTRSLLFHNFEWYNSGGSGEGQQDFFYVQPVPLPGAAWLFLTGLLSLTGFARRHAKAINE